MPKEIYNEGRVVGLSAYELYVRQLIAKQPDAQPPSERAWLNSMFGNGSAMILKIPAGTDAGVHDFTLPRNSTIVASNTIVASVFNGECLWTESSPFWAQSVTSYGGLILNNEIDYPTETNVPHRGTYLDNEDEKKAIIGYLTILDGIVYQQGTWFDSESGEPKKDLKNPSFSTDSSTPAVIRLYIHRPLVHDVKILFTGFMDKEFVSVLAGLDGSTNPLANESQNGGFLGPTIYPWASKIVFIYPNMAGALSSTYARTAPYDATREVITEPIGSYTFDPDNISGEVFTNSLIDMQSADPMKYYSVNRYSDDKRVTIPVNVTESESVQNNFNVLTTWYPGMTVNQLNSLGNEPQATADSYFFPPALYGAHVTTTGISRMYPLDVAAPGTVKGFTSQDRAYKYTQQLAENYSFYYKADTDDLYFFHKNIDINNLKPIGTKMSVEKYVADSKTAYKLNLSSSGQTRKAISLSKDDGTDLPLTGQGSAVTIPENVTGPSWAELLHGLATNGRIDVLGAKLRTFRSNLPNIDVAGSIKGSSISSTGNISAANSISAKSGTITNKLTVGELSANTGAFSGQLKVYSLLFPNCLITNNSSGGIIVANNIKSNGDIIDSKGNVMSNMASRIAALEAKVKKLEETKQDLLKFKGIGGQPVDLKQYSQSNPYVVTQIGYCLTYASDGSNANMVYMDTSGYGWQGLFFSTYNNLHVSTIVFPGMRLYAAQTAGSAVYHPLTL